MMILLDMSLLADMLENYGEDEQLRQTTGECGELIAAIQNYHRSLMYGHRSESLADVMEEAADVFFMVQQIRAIDPEMFDNACRKKELIVYKKLDREPPENK